VFAYSLILIQGGGTIMCGSFLLMALYSDLLKYYAIYGAPEGEYEPGDFFPNKNAPIVVYDGKRTLQSAKWGFQHSGKNKPVINARAETVMEKPMFKNSFFYRRCVIPANGFYEWKKEENGKKVKYRIGLQDEDLISLGGLYQISKDQHSREQVTFVIITTEANKQLKPIHDRMPLIVKKDQLDLWLNSDTSQELIKGIFANDTFDGAFVIEKAKDKVAKEKPTKQKPTDSKEPSDRNSGQLSLF